MVDENAGKDDYGVLLYYKYTSIPDLEELFNFYDSNCNSLGLLGRVRLSCHGVNVTVGGKLSSLEKHIDAVGSNNLFDETDFKLASCHQPLNDKVAEECGFNSLSIRIVKELVTFSSNPLLKSPEISNAGRHLTAAEFHSILENAGKRSGNDNPSFGNRLVLLDARNLYETRIGKFRSSNVTTLDPRVRQYSDLPSWIDSNSEKLRGNSVLMYCTGGIRCEMASAYIKSKGAGFENVFQLFGGIQRYLEQFPDGGFFKGKNFVFDHRVSVGSSNSNVLGTCLACNSLFDDYSSRSRCAYCRMLVLVCHGCQDKCSTYICELCQKNSKYILTVPVAEDEQLHEASKSIELEADSTLGHTALPLPSPSVNGTSALRKLRILCLHGFRQNASSFKGRTASLAKKLKNVAELVFINGTYELPFIYQPGHSISNCNRLAYSSSSPKSSSIKFAWFIDPNFSERSDGNWKMADGPFDSLQYQQQTDGFDASLQRLKTVFSQMGPFDGLLGFSQGAAMAASVSAQQQKLKGEIDFKFVVLCSGFALNLEEHSEGSINCPSLHIFGNNEGKDRQIASQASRHLASLFKDSCRMMVKHSLGHIVPTQSPYIDNIKDFLHQFL